FEIFAGGGSWEVLFGKPLLREFRAVHEYSTDTVAMTVGEMKVVLPNMSRADAT
ncbi:hypothetical protein BDZ89DRAFT_896461, partial [Hymenopellis radicata]